MVAVLDAIGESPSAIAENLGVHRATVHRDLLALEVNGRTLEPAQSGAQVRGVVRRLLAPFLADGGYLEAMRFILDEKGRPIKDENGDFLQEPYVGMRLAATKTFWSVYTESVTLQQAFGLIPRKPEEVDVQVTIGEDMDTFLDAIVGRLGKEATLEFIGALGSIGVEQRKLAERLGLSP